MDPLGIQAALKAAPAELQPLITEMLDRMDALEAKAAADENALADKLIAAVVPQIQAITQTINEAISEVLGLARQGVSIKMGPGQ